MKKELEDGSPGAQAKPGRRWKRKRTPAETVVSSNRTRGKVDSVPSGSVRVNVERIGHPQQPILARTGHQLDIRQVWEQSFTARPIRQPEPLRTPATLDTGLASRQRRPGM